MSLKAKLEAVIYAAEEPVALAQLATLFAGEALEWKAAQQAAADQAAVAAEEKPMDPQGVLGEGLEYLEIADTSEVDATEAAVAVAPEIPSTNEPESADGSLTAEATPLSAEALDTDGDVAQPATAAADNEAEAKRLARLREREVKAILKQILDELTAEYASDDRGVEIREIAGGYRMATKPECHDAVRLFVKSLKPPMKLSLPALETLAVVAYKQPVTSPEVSEIRGVEAGGVLGSLLARKLIATAGRKQVIGRPILYKTTKEFLLRFGLKDLAELPSMEEFEKMAAAEIEELEPEVVAADAAESAVELELNSPSGEELAEATEQFEGGSADTANLQDLMDAAPASNLTTAEESPASDTQAEDARTQAALETFAVTDAPPAQPHEENEAVPDAQEVEQKR